MNFFLRLAQAAGLFLALITSTFGLLVSFCVNLLSHGAFRYKRGDLLKSLDAYLFLFPRFQ